MPLPQKVIEQLGREPVETPGWAIGALLFSGGILFLVGAIYFGLTIGYEPHLQNHLTSVQSKIDTLNNSISTSDQTQLINFYSQISNLKTLLGGHVLSSQFFTWLQNNTEANVYYQSFTLSAGGSVSLTASAATEADANEQIAIFENSSEIDSINVSGVTAPQIPGGFWNFNVELIMKPSVFLAPNQ